MTVMYGIPNCDTIKKAKKYLAEKDVDYSFWDYKKEGVDELVLSQFVKEFGWEAVLNQRGTTWRKLSDKEKASVTNDATAIKLMKANPSMIKRPLLKVKSKLILGFSESTYQDVV